MISSEATLFKEKFFKKRCLYLMLSVVAMTCDDEGWVCLLSGYDGSRQRMKLPWGG
jgi:hypothetical protein